MRHGPCTQAGLWWADEPPLQPQAAMCLPDGRASWRTGRAAEVVLEYSYRPGWAELADGEGGSVQYDRRGRRAQLSAEHARRLDALPWWRWVVAR